MIEYKIYESILREELGEFLFSRMENYIVGEHLPEFRYLVYADKKVLQQRVKVLVNFKEDTWIEYSFFNRQYYHQEQYYMWANIPEVIA